VWSRFPVRTTSDQSSVIAQDFQVVAEIESVLSHCGSFTNFFLTLLHKELRPVQHKVSGLSLSHSPNHGVMTLIRTRVLGECFFALGVQRAIVAEGFPKPAIDFNHVCVHAALI